MARKFSRKLSLWFAALVTALVLFAPSHIALAANAIVTNCSNDSQLRSSLTTMQSNGGGTLTFNCGTATILLTSALPNISTHTIVDGGNKITLSGGNNYRIFVVDSGAVLTVQSIVLTNGSSSGDGGAIYSDGGGAFETRDDSKQHRRRERRRDCDVWTVEH